MGSDDERPAHPIEASVRFLDRFLIEPAELLATLAPDGWEGSPLMRVFHPSAERLPDRPIEPEREVVELLGCALWDVFSDNHAVVDAGGTKYSLGSFRGAAGEIAEAIDRRYAGLGREHEYMDFYLGTRWYAGRADLRDIYRWIFGGLRDAGCDWIYTAPRLHVTDPGGAAMPADPLIESLERAHDRAVRAARDTTIPDTVAAYRDVFGRLPRGWPPSEPSA